MDEFIQTILKFCKHCQKRTLTDKLLGWDILLKAYMIVYHCQECEHTYREEN